jgi:hypothetical protein
MIGLRNHKKILDIKILVIYDGLDEYEGNIKDIINEHTNGHKQLRNLNLITTTRLEDGFEKTLDIQKYVRVAPCVPTEGTSGREKENVALTPSSLFFALSGYIPELVSFTLTPINLMPEWLNHIRH